MIVEKWLQLKMRDEKPTAKKWRIIKEDRQEKKIQKNSQESSFYNKQSRQFRTL